MILQSLTRISLNSSHYVLPSDAEMTEIEEPPVEMEEEQAAGKSKAEEVLSRDAKDIGESAHDEAKEATMDEVREGVRSLFNNLLK